MTRDEALSTSVSIAISVTQDGEVVSFDRSAFKKNLAKAGFAIVPLKPTHKMQVALLGKSAAQAWTDAIAAYEKEQGDD